MKKTIVAIAGDLHVNSTVALCPPRFTLDDGGSYVASEPQRWIWRHWLSYWKEIGQVSEQLDANLYVILNGELADDLNHRSTQLITKNDTDMMRLSYAALKPALDLDPHIFVTRGTEAHSKSSASLDEKIAQDIGAIQDPYGRYAWWRFIGDLGGVRFDVAHHPPSGSGRSWTRGTPANTLAAETVFQYAEEGLRLPDVVARGDKHKNGDSGTTYDCRAFLIPSWQLTNAFGHKLGGGWLPIGAMYFICHGDGTYDPITRYKRWDIKKDIWREKDLQKANL